MKVITDNDGPCINCICRPVCINKLWGRIITKCKPFADWAAKICMMDVAGPGTEVYYIYTPLNKQFTITKHRDGKVFFGKGRYYEGRTL